MSVLTLDYSSLSATLELAPPSAETTIAEMGLAELTLWLNSEIASQLHSHATIDACHQRELVRALSKSVLAKIDRSTAQHRLSWIVADEIRAVVSGGIVSGNSVTTQSQVVPTEGHQAMARTPLPPLHPVFRITCWFESLRRAVQVLMGWFAGRYVPNSPTS